MQNVILMYIVSMKLKPVNLALQKDWKGGGLFHKKDANTL